MEPRHQDLVAEEVEAERETGATEELDSPNTPDSPDNDTGHDAEIDEEPGS